MGHLINPVGFHVGYFSNWPDNWSVSHNLVYAELLHSTLNFRRVMSFFFENSITDRYSILYSHFTVESYQSDGLALKMYFYDGIVEQKVAHLSQHLYFFNKRKRRSHRRMIRRFRKIKTVKTLRVGFLKLWRYYDYMLARRLIFFLIYLLKLGYPKNMTARSFLHLVRAYYKVLNGKWLRALKKNRSISVFAFVKYYIKYLVVRGFSKASRRSNRLHKLSALSTFSAFFRILDKMFYFWRPRQSAFNLAIKSNRFSYRSRYKRFLVFADSVGRFTNQFFIAFYRIYLAKFRQAKFFRFMHFIVSPIVDSLSFLKIRTELFGLDNNSISAIFLARYIARKVEMRFQIKELFTPIRRELKFLVRNFSIILGFKIQFTGRLTRRGKVRTTWILGGRMPVSTMSAQIEHAYHLGILRNGISCVRVWLYRHKSFGNYNHSFLYKVL